MIKLDIDKKLVESTKMLIRSKETDKKLSSKEYLEKFDKWLNPSKAQLLVDLIKETLYALLEKAVKEHEEMVKLRTQEPNDK